LPWGPREKVKKRCQATFIQHYFGGLYKLFQYIKKLFQIRNLSNSISVGTNPFEQHIGREKQKSY